MPNCESQSDQTDNVLAGEVEKQPKVVFEKMPHGVPLYLFTKTGENETLMHPYWQKQKAATGT